MKKYIALAILATGTLALSVTAQTIGPVITNGLAEPYGVAVDTNNNYYITDSANDRILKFTPDTGGLTNFVYDGLFNPQGIVAVSGGLAVADSGYHAIKLVAFDGTVTLLAGGGQGTNDGVGAAAQFNAPAGMAVDATGTNIYIADLGNNTIRKLTLGNSNVTTMATGFYRPAGVTVDSSSGILYVADTGNHSIKKIGTDGSVGLLAGSGSSFLAGYRDGPTNTALFNSPRGVYWLGSDNGLVISDTGNRVLRQIYPTNLVSVRTYASSDTAGLGAPVGLVEDNNGALLIADLGKNQLLKVQIGRPQAPVEDPKIGYVTMGVDRFGYPETKFTRVTNEITLNDDVIVAIVGETNTTTFYTKRSFAGGSLNDNVGSVSEPNTNNIVAPVYHEGQTNLPVSIITIGEGLDQTNVVIRARGTQPGRRSSGIVDAQFNFKVASPNINGTDPLTFTIGCGTQGAKLWYTTDGTDPTSDAPNATLIATNATPNLGTIITNVDFRVRAFRTGYAPSAVASNLFKPADIQQYKIGVVRAGTGTNTLAGIGATVIMPVRVLSVPARGLRTIQFLVEVTPTVGNNAIRPEFRALSIDPTNDFVRVEAPSESGKVATFAATAYSRTNAGIITRGLAIAYIGTNANFSLTDAGAVAMLAMPISPLAAVGDQYSIVVTNASGTSDAYQTPVPMVGTDAHTILVTNLTYVAGDTAIANWYNAGDFGNGNLNNNDVNNAFYAAMGIRVPFPFSDVFDAMDAFPVDSAGAVGGDGQIRFLDWQIILNRSLRLDTNNWLRAWGTGGRRTTVRTNLNSAPSLPAEVIIAPTTAWVRQAAIGATPVENVKPGAQVDVPVRIKVASGYKVAGLQFRAIVNSEGAAPPVVQPVQFIQDLALPTPITIKGGQEGLPANQVAAAWSLLQNPFPQAIQNIKILGQVRFTVPADAQAGQQYIVRFSNADGAPDMNTQLDFETVPAVIWIGTPAGAPPEMISDEWKTHFFGNLLNRWAKADADPDGDGVPNLAEFLAGRDPAKLRLHVLSEEWQNSLKQNGFKLQWFAAPGKRYLVERADGDIGGNWTAVTTVEGLGDLQEILDTDTNQKARFYRIRLQP